MKSFFTTTYSFHKKLIFFTFLIIGFVLADSIEIFAQSEYKRIHSHENMQRLEKENPKVRENRLKIEEWVSNNENNTEQMSDATIPIVLHILYNNEEQRISYEQIYSQIEALNRDFNGLTEMVEHEAVSAEGFGELIANIGLKFCLTAVDERGRDTSGVNYIPTERSDWSVDDAMKMEEIGGIKAWDTEKFLNIWIVDLKGIASGYAQMPGGIAETDGIVIDYNHFGTNGSAKYPFNEGKTLTHLIGNYLGLYSLWGYERCEDDYVDDTPIHNFENFGCPVYRHVSTCEGQSVEMSMNFMDSSNDACMSMFTKGQKQRIVAMLSEGGPRNNLLSNYKKIQCENQKTASNQSNEILIYPNPSKEDINIELPLASNYQTLNLQVLAPDGKIIYQTNLDNQNNKPLIIDKSTLSDGLYLFFFISESGIVYTERVLILNP